MSTFINTVSSNLRELRARLREYTAGDRGITVIKELVQNADDAGASRLEFVLFDSGDPDADNSLLHGPGLLVFNDGPFRREHEQNFTRPAGTSKSQDASAVGRFGIGLKSVFNLCEAWFWLGMSTDDGELYGVLNPWADPRSDEDHERPDWNQITEKDLRVLRGAAEGMRRGDSWLAQWIPLRQAGQKREHGGLILDYTWPVEDLLRDLSDLSPLAELLPQLGGLQTIRLLHASTPSMVPQEVAVARLTKGCGRLGRPTENALVGKQQKEGKVLGRGPHGEWELRYWLVEAVANDPELDVLHGHQSWPKVPDEGNDLGRPIFVKDKVIRHGAVTVIRALLIDGRANDWPPPGFAIGWAAFLPLGPSTQAPLADECGAWSVRLHGAFFPDHGRRHPLGFSSSASATGPVLPNLHLNLVRLQEGRGDPREPHHRQNPLDDWFRMAWNRRLAESVTLPLLLETFANALAVERSSDRAEDVLRALAMAPLVNEARNTITLHGQLVLNIRVKSQQVERVSADTRVISIPRVQRGGGAWRALVRDAVGRVEAIPDAPMVTWSDAPCILARPAFDPMSERELEAMLGPESIMALGTSGSAIAWVAELLGSLASTHRATAEEWAEKMIRTVLAKLGTAGLRNAQTQEHWRRVVRYIPADKRFESEAWRAIDLLAQDDSTVIILPVECRPSPETAGSPGYRWPGRDWLRALSSLHETVEQAGASLTDDLLRDVGLLAAGIIRMVGFQHVLADPRVGQLRLFSARSSRAGGRVLVSAANIGGRLCFRRAGMPRPDSVCDRLFRAIDGGDHDVLLVSDKALATTLDIPELTEEGVLRCFLGEDALPLAGEVSPRADLLDALLTSYALASLGEQTTLTPERHPIRRGIRLLLTGDVRASNSSQTLLVDEDGLPLSSLGIQTLLELQKEGWRLLDDAVMRNVTQPWRRELGIQTVTAPLVLGLLNGRTDDELVRLCHKLGVSDRDGLLILTADDAELWPRLPAHETTIDDLVSSRHPGLVCLREGHDPPEVLLQQVLTLRPSKHDTVARLQRERIESWGPQAAVRLALHIVTTNQATSLAIAIALMDAFRLLQENEVKAVEEHVKQQAWLPLLNGQGVMPGDILDLPEEIAGPARRLLACQEGCFVLPRELAPEVHQHPAFRSVLALCAETREAAVEGLALRFTSLSTDQIAPFLLGPDPESLPPLGDVSIACPRFKGDTGWRIVLETVRYLESADYPPDLVDALTGPVDVQRLIAQLQLLQGQPSGDLEADPACRVHRHMLGWLAAEGPLEQQQLSVLEKIELPNAHGSWADPGSLTAIDNARPDYRLHPLWAEALGFDGTTLAGAGVKTGLADRKPSAELDRARGRLERYFADWHAHVPSAALGLFVALLGDGPGGELEQLAQSWLGSLATVTTVRKESNLDARNRIWKVGDAGLQYTSKAQLAVAVLHEGTAVHAPNLLGRTIEVPVGAGESLDSLLIGNLEAEAEPQWLLLTELRPSALTPADLLRLLRQASHDVFLNLTGWHAGPRLDQLWERLEAGGQVEVEVTRRMIRRELPAQLRLMGLAGSNSVARRLATAVKIYRHHEQTIVELNLADDDDPDRRRHREHRRIKAREDASEALTKLEKLIEGDEAHRFLLGRVQERLRDEQYDLDRVPFELFQNADDAVAQLEAMIQAEGRPLPARARRFEVEVAPGGKQIRVWHWGRGINRHYLGPGFTQGRDLGYDQDLLHMMLLHASDKGEQKRATGRFGLGFKSVHLVTDQVRVQSERLAFEVRGGFLPAPLELNEEWLARKAERQEPTVVEISMTVPAEAVMGEFLAVAGVLPVVAQALSTVAVLSDEIFEYSWEPKKAWNVGDAGDILVAVGDIEFGPGNAAAQRVLVVRESAPEGPGETFIIGLEGGSVAALPEGVPTIWCTVPTSLGWATGWCLNGPFQVDVGRSQLGRTRHHAEDNQRVAQRIGRRLAAGLHHLTDLLDDDWDAACDALLLPRDSEQRPETLVRFWQSLWVQLSNGLLSADGDSVKSQILGAFGRGWFEAFRHEQKLPTRLAGSWNGLTRIAAVRWVVDEALSLDEVARVASAWPWLSGRYPAGNVIHPEVRDVVEHFRGTWRLGKLTLETLVRAAWADRSPVGVTELGALAPLYAWLNRSEAPLPVAVAGPLRHALRGALFPSASTKERPASKLLLQELSGDLRAEIKRLGGKRAVDDLELTRDELLLAGFAPPAWVLHPDIATSPKALLIYLEARRDGEGIEVDELVAWAHAAASTQLQQAVLSYVSEGKRAKELGRKLRTDLPRWAKSPEALSQAGLLRHLLVDQVARVMALLFPEQVTTDKQKNTQRASSRISLRRVHDWWMRHRDTQLQAFHKNEWPEDWHDREHLGRVLEREEIDEEAVDAWMTTLLLASLRSLGRASPAHHTGFLRRLKEEGAWETFLTDPRQHPEVWTAALREWEDKARDKPKFQRWWMFFPVAHQLRGHLEVYVRVLRRAGHRDWGERPLQERLKPRVADVYSLAGHMFSAPFLPAGIGAHWLVRELSRLGVSRLPGTAARFAWTPDAELRRFFFGIGLELHPDLGHDDAARQMDHFVRQRALPDPTFMSCFCIPLRMVLRSPELSAELGIARPSLDPASYTPVSSTNDWEDEK